VFLKLQDAQLHRISYNNNDDMRWLLSILLLGLLSVVHAVSSSGSKLLVVLEELADKAKYSKYLADLESAFIPGDTLFLSNLLIDSQK
jgi:hypothetical protein